jgi:uracil-DNA glycosylase
MEIEHKLETSVFKSNYSVLLKDWAKPLSKNLLCTSYMNNLAVFIDEYYKNHVNVYPKKEELFNCFRKTPFDKLKVVCFGLRPTYLTNGLAYGVSDVHLNQIIPDINKKIINCVNDTVYEDTQEFDNTMKWWANQGVLMLNTSLTWKFGEDHSEYWKNFVRQFIYTINEEKENIVFLFLEQGNEHFKKYIDNKKHYVFENTEKELCNTNNIFNQVNSILRSDGIREIIW